MSATSSAERTTMRLRRLQHLQRTDDLAQQVGGDLRVDHRGVEFLVAERRLDDADVDLLPSRWVAKQWRSVCIDTRLSMPAARGGGLNSAIELTRAPVTRSGWAGNNQPPSSILPCARATRHHTRNRSSRGESIA